MSELLLAFQALTSFAKSYFKCNTHFQFAMYMNHLPLIIRDVVVL